MMRVLGFSLGIIFIMFFCYSLIYIKHDQFGYVLASLSILLGILFLAYGVKGNKFVTPIIRKILSW